MRFDRRGSGEPLVLLHGVGSRHGIFDPVVPLLAAHHDVIAVDLPGFGVSPDEPGADGSIAGYADAVERLADSLGVQRFHVVGNSMGGGIALELGARGRALSVTAFSPIGFWRTGGLVWVRTAVRTMRALAGVLRPALPVLARPAAARVALFGVFYGRPTTLAVDQALLDVDGLLGATGVEPALAGFGRWRPKATPALRAVPVTIAWGSRDLLLTYATQARHARWLMPWARHVTLDGCGHLPFSDDPVACLDAVLSTTTATTGEVTS